MKKIKLFFLLLIIVTNSSLFAQSKEIKSIMSQSLKYREKDYTKEKIKDFRLSTFIQLGKLKIGNKTREELEVRFYHPDAPRSAAQYNFKLKRGEVQLLKDGNGKDIVLGNDWGVQFKQTRESAIFMIGEIFDFQENNYCLIIADTDIDDLLDKGYEDYIRSITQSQESGAQMLDSRNLQNNTIEKEPIINPISYLNSQLHDVRITANYKAFPKNIWVKLIFDNQSLKVDIEGFNTNNISYDENNSAVYNNFDIGYHLSPSITSEIHKSYNIQNPYEYDIISFWTDNSYCIRFPKVDNSLDKQKICNALNYVNKYPLPDF